VLAPVVLPVERCQAGVKALADALGESRDGVGLRVQRAAARRQRDRRFAACVDDLDRCPAEGANEDELTRWQLR
jgi:hypothetical protein